MVLQIINMLPGVSKSDSPYSESKMSGGVNGKPAAGRFTDCQNVRWVAGAPEKLGGWIAGLGTTSYGDFLTDDFGTDFLASYTGDVVLSSPARALLSYRNSLDAASLVIATDTTLYTYDGSALLDITPQRTIATGTLTGALTTVNGSAVVTVADVTQTLQNGDWVFLSSSAALNGITLNGWYVVAGQSGAGYTVTAGNVASGAGSGGGTITYQYPRITLTNPFTTVITSATVTVAHTLHGATTGDHVNFGSATVGGILISGKYTVTVIDVNTYTIVAATAALSSETGGGSVSVSYDITTQTVDIAGPVGFGNGAFGSGEYSPPGLTSITQYTGWFLSAYGTILAVCPIGGTIYFYDAAQGGRAYPLLNAPATMNGMFITRERFIVAVGINGNRLKMAWCDQTDPTNWTTTITDTANSGRTLQIGDNMVAGLPVRDQISLVFTNSGTFQMIFTGDNNVYATPDVADNTGLIGPHAAVAVGESAYWMGPNDFWMWTGTPQHMPSDDIREYVYSNINRLYAWKACAGVNRAFQEVWFSYPTGNATENTDCVIYSILQQCWYIGPGRSAWTDSELFGYPFAGDSTGAIFQHETGKDADGAAMPTSLTFSPLDISSGAANVNVAGWVTDFERLVGSQTLDLTSQYYPSDTVSTQQTDIIGPTTGRIDARVDGKLIGFNLTSNDLGDDFRLGLVRLDVQPSGARR